MRHALLALALLAAPATAQELPGSIYDVRGVDPDDRADRIGDRAVEEADEARPSYYGNRYLRAGPAHGQAVRLDPWLRDADGGLRWVLERHDRDGDGRIDARAARRANAAFRAMADADRDMRLTDEEIGLALAGLGRRPF